MRSVVAPLAQSVVSLVVNLYQPFRSLCVRPDPTGESLPDFGQPGLCTRRFRVVDDCLLFSLDDDEVVDRRLAQVQPVVNQLNRMASSRPPRLRSLYRLQREMIGVGNRPRAKLFVILRLSFVTR